LLVAVVEVVGVVEVVAGKTNYCVKIDEQR
jgi:hypothetical protein